MAAGLAVAWLFAAIPGHGAPNPTGFSGTIGHGNSGTVTGTAFGSKSQGGGKFWLVFTFEDGSLNSDSTRSWGPSTAIGTQNMTVSSDARGDSAKTIKSDAINWASFANGGIVAVDTLMPSVGRNGKVFKYQKRKSSRSNFTHTNGAATQYENWKFDRFWINTNGSGYPNGYNAQNADSAGSCTGGGAHPSPVVEAGSGANYVKTSSAYRLPGSTWMAEERLIKFASANTIGDGLYKIRQDGQLNIDRSDFKTDPSASFPGASYRRWYTQDDPSNLTDCGGSTVSHDVWYDDVVYDYGVDAWARVYIGNASTLAACTKVELQYPTSWSTTSITFVQNEGDLSGSEYLYVCDSNDLCNSSGLLLVSGGNPDPVVNTVTPSTGPLAGANTVTIAGQNFLSGSTVLIGTSPATGVNILSATSITCVVPGRASTGTVNVSVSSGAQTGTGINLYAYVPSSPSISGVSPNTCTTLGGCVVTITGANLLETQDVTFGGVSATNETSISATELTCIVPAFGSAEAVNVTIITSAGSATLSNGLTYTTPPVLPTEKVCPCAR